MLLTDYPVSDCVHHLSPQYDDIVGMQNQYRDPPPYPGHSKQLHNQPGLRQSFSGSETSTDVSVSSTENLATSQRQEPQGEETKAQNLYNQLDLNAGTTSDYSILARLGMPTTTVELQPAPVPAYLITGPPQGKVYTVHSEVAATSAYTQGHLTVPQWSPGSATTPTQQQQQVTIARSVEHNQNLISTYRTIPTYVNSQWSPQWSNDQLQNSQLVSYLSNLPPPPEYPGPKGQLMTETTDSRKSGEMLDKIELTKSQPDLSRLSEPQPKASIQAFGSEPKFTTAPSDLSEEVDHVAIAAHSTQMIEMLSEENRRLREELDINHKKVSKLQKFEFEIQKVHEAYESLVKSSEKRERLEAELKKRLEEELRKVKAEHHEVKEKLQKSVQDSQAEEATIGQLLAQNKELLSLTRRDSSNKLSILESAFSGAKGKLDEASQQSEADKMAQLQKAFVCLQSASERRENMERQLRNKMEKELDSLRAQQKLGWKRRNQEKDVTNMTVMKRMLAEKESRIMELETELAKSEQQCLEESTMRQLALEDSVGSKDGRLAALEKSSMETEKLINEAKSEKLKHMEELYNANRKCAEMEAKVKSLTSQLSEKEAMLKVYQRSPMTRSSSVHTIYCSPLHSPRPSIIASSSTLNRQSDFPLIKHVKTGSASAIDTRSTVEDELREKLRDLQTESKDHDSDEEGKMLLWQV